MTLKATPIQRVSDRSALMERYSADTDGPGIGVMWGSDLAVTAGSGMNSSVAAGRARIRAGTSSSDRGVYDFWNDAVLAVTHNTADATNPRIDQVLARVRDAYEIGGSNNVGDIYIQHGTPTSGTTLDLRNGVTTPDPSTLLLADVLVPAGAASAASFTYRNRRPFAVMGVIPPMMSAGNQVAFMSAGVPWGWPTGVTGPDTGHNASQACVLAYLPARITATKIKWWSRAGSPNASGTFNLGIYDSLGLKLVETGAIAFPASNSANTHTITSTTFEPGLYQLVAGWSIASGSLMFYGAHTKTSPMYGQASVTAPNLMGRTASGGTTLPSNLQISPMTDITTLAADASVPWMVLAE